MSDTPPPSKTPAVVGIDVGGTKSLGLVLDSSGDVVLQEKWPTPKGANEIVSTLAGLTRELVERTADTHHIRGVGVGIAGLVDNQGRLRRAPNLIGSDEFAVRDLLEPVVNVPVLVDNDANCAARAELHVGVAIEVSHALLITLGTGIGGALIVEGEIDRGAAGMAGEPGHMMVDPNGPKCVCGQTGCWERYASGAGLAHLARLATSKGSLDGLIQEVGSPDEIRGEHVTRAARLGDPDATAVLDTFARWVAIGMANCCALLDPELIVVGGGLVRDWDLFGERVVTHLDDVLVASAHRPRIRVEAATAGEAAGALGAAFLAAAETGVLR